MKETTPNTRGHGLVYLHVFADLRAAARKCGYALAVHGSLDRDLDLIAVPWTEEATDADRLVHAICEAWGFGDGLMALEPHGPPKLHGRIAYTLIPGGPLFVDLSVMPRATSDADAIRRAVEGMSDEAIPLLMGALDAAHVVRNTDTDILPGETCGAIAARRVRAALLAALLEKQ